MSSRPAGTLVFLVAILAAVAAGSCVPDDAKPARSPVVGDADDADATPATQLAREITSAARYQTSLPDAEPTPTRSQPPAVGPGLTILFRLLVYAMIAVVLALTAVWLAGFVARRGASDPDAGDKRELHASPDRAHGLGLSAETLASDGRYGEAIHALLLIAIARLKRRGSLQPHPAMTSREIVRGLPGDAPVREALGELVRRVELTHFGEKPAGPDEWAACRQHFRKATGEDPA